jgi:hypothetical protein
MANAVAINATNKNQFAALIPHPLFSLKLDCFG